MATAAATVICARLTTSFVSHSNPSSPCVVAPTQLSSVVATNAASVAIPAPLASTCPAASAARAKAAAAMRPARGPSRLTAPSVPRGTLLNGGVDMYVVFPYAFPTSLAVVSLSLEQNDATNPRRNASAPGATPDSAHAAHSAPATPLPHTDAIPLRPPLASAIPSACFCFIFSFVTALPRTK